MLFVTTGCCQLLISVPAAAAGQNYTAWHHLYLQSTLVICCKCCSVFPQVLEGQLWTLAWQPACQCLVFMAPSSNGESASCPASLPPAKPCACSSPKRTWGLSTTPLGQPFVQRQALHSALVLNLSLTVLGQMPQLSTLRTGCIRLPGGA